MSSFRARFIRSQAAPVLACTMLLSACGGSADPVENAAIDQADVAGSIVNGPDNAAPAADAVANEAVANEAAPASEAAAEASAEAGPVEEAPAAAASAPAAETASAGDAANGAKLFVQCRVCHSIEPGKNGLGPSLHGVVGIKAAAVEGFNYSPAMKNSGVVWTREALSDYLRAPMKSMPGTKMAFAGIADDARRADIIAYLETLK